MVEFSDNIFRQIKCMHDHHWSETSNFHFSFQELNCIIIFSFDFYDIFDSSSLMKVESMTLLGLQLMWLTGTVPAMGVVKMTSSVLMELQGQQC